jgi:hypothetical protein
MVLELVQHKNLGVWVGALVGYKLIRRSMAKL